MPKTSSLLRERKRPSGVVVGEAAVVVVGVILEGLLGTASLVRIEGKGGGGMVELDKSVAVVVVDVWKVSESGAGDIAVLFVLSAAADNAALLSCREKKKRGEKS